MTNNPYQEILDCLEQPAFLVRDGAILLRNAKSSAAEEALCACLQNGIPEGVQTIADAQWNFSLRPCGDAVLVLASPYAPPQDAMQETAKTLRTALAGLYSTVHALLPSLEEQDNPRTKQQTAALNRTLHQLFRLVGNMETASAETLVPHMARLDLRDFLENLYHTAAPLCTVIGKQLDLHLPRTKDAVITSADRQMLERAVLNLIANAMRASGDRITLRLYTANHHAVIEVQTSCDDTEENPLTGAELGLDIVRRIAQCHGGTLMCRPLEHTAMLTVSLRRTAFPLRTRQTAYDYSGGFDHALLELSDVLPSTVYQTLDTD